MAHPFSSMTPAQVRSQHQQANFTLAQQNLLSEVEDIVAQVPTRVPAYITLPELQTIMDYKLAFGQNRPALRAMIRKNPDAQVKEVSERALAHSLEDGDWEEVQKAMDILCELKGVGPATASLLLSLLYPRTIPFFSDEATVNLLAPPGGAKGIKYTAKTYKALYDALDTLMTSINQNAPSEDPICRGELERKIWRTFRVEELPQSKGKRARDQENAEEKPKRKRKKT
ncbi:hypothetical protein LshimejAT787_0302560 [Lyophyllum shimeji]|uniref:Uncharacterized protein n=1 Tax=Lyophyllum shimeji TaxID=47721 RepID=A0A9P3PHE0_LYOSH|nr:hypothetical protein LshimejAT787_0302560 [Lyophyllum shimeji]